MTRLLTFTLISILSGIASTLAFAAKPNVILVITDNGTAGGWTSDGENIDEEALGFNAGMRGYKGSYFDGGHRVPFFIRWPAGGLTGGRDVSTLTAHFDVIPTLADLCGLKVPEKVRPEGISFAPLLRKQTAEWPDRKIFVQHHMHWTTPVKGQAAVLTQRWRLVGGNQVYDHGLDFRNQLYDIQADPGLCGETA